MRAALAIAAAPLLLLAACGGSDADEPAADDMTPQQVAEKAGCTDVQETGNEADLAEVTCTLGGEEVTITDWSGVASADRDGLIAMTVDMGYSVIEVGDMTVGAESRDVVDTIRGKVGGDWVE